MSTTPEVMTTSAPQRRTAGRSLLVWAASFLAFPAAGFLGMVVIGRVDSIATAVAGGAILGAILGFTQALLSSGRLPRLRWTLATVVGAGVGVAAGGAAVGFGTTLADLATGGLITGLAVGVAQAIALPQGVRFRWLWAALAAALWSLAWVVTTVIGVTVGEQFIVFGSSGAIVYTILSGLALQFLVPLPRSARTSG